MDPNMKMNYNDMNTPSRCIGMDGWTLWNNEIFSFYIPRISKNYTEEDIRFVFNINCIGEVKRVDFADITSENHRNNTYNSAFVHMNNILNTPLGNMIINETHDMNTSYKLYTHPTRPEYWVLLKNHKPIKDTDLNIHQLAENTRFLEERVTSQDIILTEPQDLIKKQQDQIERLQESIDQLIGQDNDNIMTIDELNTDNTDNRQINNNNFESSLDMNTRKLFSTHLCNN